jgi:hypothetical protein
MLIGWSRTSSDSHLDTAILTTIVSAVVSLAVTLITVFVSRSSIKTEREKLERELQQTMTVRLYDARLGWK